MDPIKAEKFRAMKSYKKKNHFAYNLVLHFLAALICCLLWSYPNWFLSLCSSMKHFCLISLPCIWSSFVNPKCLFVVVNVIVIFLVGESKLLVSTSSSPTGDIYNEYVERSQNPRRVISTPCEKTKDKKVEEEKGVEPIIKEKSRVENKQEEEEEKENHEKVETVEEDDQEKKEEEEEEEEEVTELPLTLVEGEDKERRDKEEEEEEEDGGLPTEELNKKVEEFIARVNKQRWREVNSLLCFKA